MDNKEPRLDWEPEAPIPPPTPPVLATEPAAPVSVAEEETGEEGTVATTTGAVPRPQQPLFPYAIPFLGMQTRKDCSVCQLPLEYVQEKWPDAKPVYCPKCARVYCQSNAKCQGIWQAHQCNDALRFDNIRPTIEKLYEPMRVPEDEALIEMQQKPVVEQEEEKTEKTKEVPVEEKKEEEVFITEEKEEEDVEKKEEKEIPIEEQNMAGDEQPAHILSLIDPLTIALSLWVAARHIPLLNESVKQGMIHRMRMRAGFWELMVQPMVNPNAVEDITNAEEVGKAAVTAQAEALAQGKIPPCLLKMVMQRRGLVTMESTGENKLMLLFGAHVAAANPNGDTLAQLLHAYHTYWDRQILIFNDVAGLLETAKSDKGVILFSPGEIRKLRSAYHLIQVSVDQQYNRYDATCYIDVKPAKGTKSKKPEEMHRSRGIMKVMYEDCFQAAWDEKQQPMNYLFLITLVHRSKEEAECTLGVGKYAPVVKKGTPAQPKKKTEPKARAIACRVCRKERVKLHHCQQCNMVTYCGPECQLLDWPTHKGPCRAARGKKLAVEAEAAKQKKEEKVEQLNEYLAGPRPMSTTFLVRLYGMPDDPQLVVMHQHTTFYSLRQWMDGKLHTEATERHASAEVGTRAEDFDVMITEDRRMAEVKNPTGFFAAQRVKFVDQQPYWSRANLHGHTDGRKFFELLDECADGNTKPKRRTKAYADLTGVHSPRPLEQMAAVVLCADLAK